jgi:hypothetical protein
LLTDLLDDLEYESERSPELIDMLIESVNTLLDSTANA